MKKDYSLIKTIQTGKIYRILSLTFLLAVTSLRLSAQYCTPSFVSGCTGNDVISSFTLKSIVNPSGCSSGGYGDYTSISAPTLYIGQTYPVTISTIYGTAAVAIWIDYNDDFSFDPSEKVGYTTSLIGGNSSQAINIAISATATAGTHRLRARLVYQGDGAGMDPCVSYTFGEAEDYLVNLAVFTPCSGTPNAGNATSTSTAVCANTSFDLSLINNTETLGLDYQWQSSADGVSWSDLGQVQHSLTSPVTINSITATTYYHCVVTCTNSSQSVISTPVTVIPNALMNCYCMPSYSWNCSGDRFQDFSLANVVAQGSNCDANGFSDSTASNYTSINLNAGNTYTLLVNTLNSGSYGNAVMGAWIDYNQNTVFDGDEFTYLGFGAAGTYSNTLTVPLMSQAGSVRMRLKLDANYATSGTSLSDCYNNNYSSNGQILDYKVNIAAASPCSGTPNAGNAVSTASAVCNTAAFDLNLNGGTIATGLTYQWQSSSNGVAWSNLGSSQNTAAYTVNTQTAVTYYRCISTCTNGGASATSNSVVVGHKLLDCYCTPNYPSFMVDCTQDKIVDFSIANVVSQQTNCDAYGFSDSTASNYTSINLTAGNTYTLLVNTSISGSNGDGIVGAWIDLDQNSVFDSNEYTAVGVGQSGTYSTSISLPITVNSGVVRMRIMLDAYYGYTGKYLNPCASNAGSLGQILDYKVNITAAPPCSGTPNVGNAISSLGSVCSFNTYTLDLTGNDQVSGLTYQWQSSADGSSWANLGSPQNIIPYSVSSQTAATYYRCAATCINGGATGASNPVVVNQNIATACYCIPAMSNCSTAYISNVIIETLNDNPNCNSGVNGYLDNTGSVPSASVSANQSYTISTTVGSQGYPTYAGVWVDYDHSGTFDSNEYSDIGNTYSGTLTGTLNIPFTAIGGNTRMRLKVQGTYSFSQLDPCIMIGQNYGQTIDYLLNITPVTPCAGTPNAGTISAPASVCSGNSFTIDLVNNDIISGASYQWQSSPDGSTWTNLGAAQNYVPFSVSSQSVATYYRCLVTCLSSSLSATSTSTMISVNSYTACYCIPDITNCGQGDEIQNVTFETINNSSGCDGTDGYSDYTASAITATIQAAQTYTMNVTIGNMFYENVSVWIDYDQNGSFDASEYTFLGSTINSSNVVSGSINVPVIVTPGVTRMRVRNFLNNTLGANDACYSPTSGGDRLASPMGPGFSAGETEDYLITLLPPDCSSLTYTTPYSITGTLAICPGQTASLDISPTIPTAIGTTYQWRSFNGTTYVDAGSPSASSLFTTSPSSNTLYYCEIQCHTNPVKNTDTVLIKINSITTAPVSTSVTCNGICDGSATVNASSSGSTLTYSWTPAIASSDMAVGLCAGSYSVNVVNSTGCLVTETFTIVEPTAITPNPSQSNVSCYGLSDGTASVSVTGGTTPYTYSWSPSGGNGSSASGLIASSYSVMIVDGNNCNKTTSFTITQPTQLSLNISPISGSCLGGATGQASALASGGTPSYSYTWSSGGSTSTGSGLPIGVQTCTVSDANTCTTTQTVNISQADNFSVTISANNSICEQLKDSIVSTITGGSGSFSYSWIQQPTNATANTANFTYTSSIGSYTYNLGVVDNSNNCVVSSNTFTNQVNPSSNISGTVTTGSIAPAPVAGLVILYKYLPYFTKFDSVASQPLGASGDYNFVSFTSGRYIVKAVPSANNLQIAYGDTAVNWKTAKEIIHGCAVTDIQNINVKALPTFTPGPGSLSGIITQTVGYNSHHRSFASYNNDNNAFKPLVPGTPIGGIVVKGGKNPGGQMMVQTTTSNSNPGLGTYTLSGLPYGDYFVLVDIPGLDTNNTYHVKIAPGDTVFRNLDFTVDSIQINPLFNPNVSVHDLSAKEHKIRVYPNPATNYVTIQYDLQNSALVQIELFDILGKSVRMLLPATPQSIDSYKSSWQLDDLKAGLYFIKININGSESTIKLSVSN